MGTPTLHRYFTSHPAPVAPMMPISSTRPMSAGRLPSTSSVGRSKGRPSYLFSPPRTRSTGNSTQDFQAEVDRMETIRDRSDPDYRQEPKTPRKRKATIDISPKSSKKRSPTHVSYDSLKDSTSITERDRHLARIRENWGEDTAEWMPRSVWPCKASKSSGGRQTRQPIEDPRDWNGPLLEELSYLSAVTKDKPRTALNALDDAVLQRQEAEGSSGSTQVLKEDVMYANSICKAAEPSPSHTSPFRDDEEAFDEQGTAEQLQDEMVNGLPALRSPTMAKDEPRIKTENQSITTVTSAESLTSDVWSGYEDEMDKLEEAKLEAEENEALAAAKRAKREQIRQKRYIREMMRKHGRSRDNAILLGSEEAGI